MKKLYLFLLLLGAYQLHAQSILVPYRVGKLWGLADTLGNIKVVPAYDEINTINYVDYQHHTQPDAVHTFIVRKGTKYGLLRNGQVIMALKYHRLLADSMFITEDNSRINDPTVGGSRELLYSYHGKPLITDTVLLIEPYVNAQTRGRRLFVVTGYKNNGGVFWYDPKTEKIEQWIIKGANYVVAGRDADHLYIYEISETGQRQTVEMVFNASTKKYEVKPANPPPAPEMGTNAPRRAGYATSTHNFMVHHIEFSVTGGKATETRRNRGYTERGKGKTDTIRFNLSADSVQLLSYYMGNSLVWPSTIPQQNQPLLEKLDSAFEYVNYIAYFKNGKEGLIGDRKVIPAAYHDMIYFESGIYEKPYFLVSQPAKDGTLLWGVISIDGKQILPVEYNQVRRGNGGGGSWILKKGDKYGLIDYQGKLVVPVQYDLVAPDQYFLSFTIMDKGKYGYWNSLVGFCKPVFPHKVIGFSEFDGYDVYQLADQDEKFIGYGDKKGFLYFKN